MSKPCLFVGSATENKGIVNALESELREVAVIERWDVDVFRPGHFTLEELTEIVKKIDFAVFVLGQNDVTESRGKATPSPRDNVVFEAGLFTAVLGRERTFYIVDTAGTKIPSDWAGIGYLIFDDSQPRPRDKVYDAAAKIREQIATWQPSRSLGAIASIVGYWWQFVINDDVGSVLSLLEIAAEKPANLWLTGTSWSPDGALDARYRSRAANFNESERTLYYYWEGQHPREKAIPTYFGVGEIVFRTTGTIASQGEGWFSTSSASEVTNTLAKSTAYVRVSPDELTIMQGADRDKRAALVRAKLVERQQPYA